ncbi:hypothetical protein KJI95_03445 [Shewanella sp. JM162201]|uniref:Uncharacterized protein n=1 Tax=Shewanella jiangmenensis TaxID=2837387 RepID=A0ABS5V1C9_9GAMM|nr:hypothetical protein [Shewanella jiangmenensis]MBT1443576.1 hypothetical protein [Shewanella jiangmenensis]
MTPSAEMLLLPYRDLSLSAWDRLRLGFSLCVHAGLAPVAFKGGDAEAYWFMCDNQLYHCGRCNSYQAEWQVRPLSLSASLTPMTLEAIPQSQLGFLLVETAHFDHC